jgi:NTP pyrophosphatase (non-canonical NTP hydrolase)
MKKAEQMNKLEEQLKFLSKMGLNDESIVDDLRMVQTKAEHYYILEKKIERWAYDKEILDKGNTMAQAEKTHEEVLELMAAINDDDKHEIIDALGDILVTIIIQAKMQNVKLIDCLQVAYNVISKRTGKMEDGKFKKD